MNKIFKFAILIIIITSLGSYLGSCENKSFRQSEGMIWNTMYHATYQSDQDLNDSIINTLEQVGNSLNIFDPESVVSQVNDGNSIKIDNDFIKVYEASLRINKLTDGAFDPTLGPLIQAWGFGKGHTATSDTLRIDSLLSIVGISRTRISNGLMIKDDDRIQFNFSAIAKGYGCDRAGEMMKRNGVTNYMIEIGGEIVCAGHSPSGEDWKISVDRPIVSESVIHESQCVIQLADKGIATSGNYRNFHEMSHSRERYGHTISSKTGRPIETDVISATVVAPSAMEADALATSIMAMGSEGAKELSAKTKLPIMIVLSDFSVWYSTEFQSLMVDNK